MRSCLGDCVRRQATDHGRRVDLTSGGGSAFTASLTSSMSRAASADRRRLRREESAGRQPLKRRRRGTAPAGRRPGRTSRRVRLEPVPAPRASSNVSSTNSATSASDPVMSPAWRRMSVSNRTACRSPWRLLAAASTPALLVAIAGLLSGAPRTKTEPRRVLIYSVRDPAGAPLRLDRARTRVERLARSPGRPVARSAGAGRLRCSAGLRSQNAAVCSAARTDRATVIVLCARVVAAVATPAEFASAEADEGRLAIRVRLAWVAGVALAVSVVAARTEVARRRLAADGIDTMVRAAFLVE
jgi:hypothetical protein